MGRANLDWRNGTWTTEWGQWCDAWKINNSGPARTECGLPAVGGVAGVIYLCRKHLPMVEGAVPLGELAELERQNSTLRAAVAQYEERTAEERAEAMDRWANDYMSHALQDPADRKPTEARSVYFIACEDYVKIGVSLNPENRLRSIRVSGNGTRAPKLIDLTTARILATIPGDLAEERELHDRFAAHRAEGEWFHVHPELMDYIDSLTKEAKAA